MICPFCQHTETKVSDSRPDPAGQSIRRRRECLQCSKRWRTIERFEDEMPLVIKRNHTHQPFAREKLLNSLKVACGKRPVSMNQLDQIVAEIEWSILEMGAKEITTVRIGEKVMAALKGIDEIAYVRYASVYRRFKDVGELMAEMQQFVS